TLPAAVALVLIGTEVSGLLFRIGAFTDDDVAQTGLALSIFALGLPAYVLIKALSPAFFAEEDTRRPLRYAAISMLVNTALSIGLAPSLGWIAIPIATALSAWLNAGQLWWRLATVGGYAVDARLARRLMAMTAASLAMGGVIAVAAVWMGPELTAHAYWRFPSVLGLVALGLGAYAIFATALGAVSLSELRGALRRGASS
ncbi:MAG: lipid II flippase MurJ, partial [Pseudomonadota bacterium]